MIRVFKQQNARWMVVAAVLLLATVTGWVVVDGYREATRAPVVVAVQVQSPDVTRPLRVAFLADTHAGGPDMPPARLREIVRQVNALRPDLVLLGGDYVKGTPLGLGVIPAAAAVDPLGGLRAPMGVVAVLGNNDCAGGQGDRIAGLLAARGIRVLRNQAALLDGATVLGVDDVIHCTGNLGPAKLDYARQVKARGSGRPDGPVLMLSHEPAFAPYAPDYADVSLAGHTHGGQMFPAFTGWLIRRFGHLPAARGLMQVKGKPLVITSGVGTNNLPLRIGVPPEIMLLTLSAPDQD